MPKSNNTLTIAPRTQYIHARLLLWFFEGGGESLSNGVLLVGVKVWGGPGSGAGVVVGGAAPPPAPGALIGDVGWLGMVTGATGMTGGAGIVPPGFGFGFRGGLSGGVSGGVEGNLPPASAKYEFENGAPQCGHFDHAGLTDPTPSFALQPEQYHSDICGVVSGGRVMGGLLKGGRPGCA